jgi:acetoin utilization protein AcuB
MTKYDQPISVFMSKRVHVIDMETSLPKARQLMTEHEVRHLPVVDGSKIVGLLSERDLGKLEAFPMLDLNLVSVPDAMSDEPYVVTPNTPLIEVVRTMRSKRLGSAIIGEGSHAIGIFTTMDALGVLVAMLQPGD